MLIIFSQIIPNTIGANYWQELVSFTINSLVVDEFGNMAGIVTLEDVFETLIGTEILDESDLDTDMQELARKEWQQRSGDSGIISFENLKEY